MNVVFIHGFCENHSVWDDFLALLPKQHQYFAPNISELTHCQKMDDYAKYIKKQLDEAQVEKAVFIGHSMGGYIALAFAELFPEMITGLGLFHSSAYADSEERKETRLKAIQYIVKHGAKDFIEDFLPNMFNTAFKKQHTSYIQKKIGEYSEKISEEALIAATLAMRDRSDRTKILKEADYPFLMIAGGKDKFVAMAVALEQITLLKNPYCLILNDIAHAGMLESPELCAKFITEFIEKAS
jgi:pimeloyl-ACP methyl ester carboxylesterase